jgi:outer membrane protein assembly factor BamD (BamD/ComL family)
MAVARQDPEAEQLLESVAASYPNSEHAAAAKMRIAYLHSKDKAERSVVQSDFLGVATSHPNSFCAMESLYRAARLALKSPPDFASALSWLNYIRDNSGDEGLQAEAMVDIGLTYLQRFFHDGTDPQDFVNALNTLRAVKVTYPDQPNAIGRAELRIGRYYLYSEKDSETARAVFESYLSAYPTTAIAEIKYQLAYCSFEQKLYSDAAARCLSVIGEKDVDWGWKAWCAFFLGHCYLQAKDYAAARTAFQNVIDVYPNTEFSEISKRAIELMPSDSGSGR